MVFPEEKGVYCFDRTLTGEEIRTLEKNGSHSSNWSMVRITPSTDLSLIRNCVFRGPVSIHLPGGTLFGTTMENCTVIGPVTVESNGIITGMTLHPECMVRYCGKVSWTDAPGFLRGSIQAGLETGERPVPLLPNLDHNDVAELAYGNGRSEVPEVIAGLTSVQNDIRGFIGSCAVVESCPVLENTVVMENAEIDGAAAVRGSILLPGSAVKDGAVVRESVMQWNARADSMAMIQESIVGECSTVENHGKLLWSFLGADSVLGGGEVTASVVGPLTGMHHQSLLIAALWPGGRGNLGYGANIGSNHTSRLPDQEIRPGTGMFFGLGVSVKFPSDFSTSPFSVIATGLTTLPQRVEFPFSLIALPAERPAGIPEGFSRLVPGWMLHSNLYSVLRNLWKYKNRRRAVRTPVETGVFTDEVLGMVEDAMRRLESGSGYTPPGAGKNFVTPDDREAGIQAYRKCLRVFALLKLLENNSLDPGEAGELLDLLNQTERAVKESREKDFRRGAAVINDYCQVHTPSAEDPFLLAFRKKAASIEKTLLAIRDRPLG